MIASRAPKLTFGTSGRTAADFKNAAAYIARQNELKEGQKPALAVWSQGVSSLENAGVEMERTALHSRAAEPLYLLTASWSPGEMPTRAQAKEALDIYIEQLGFAGLQYVASLQNDAKAGLYRLHAVFNLFDPVTKTARSTWHEAQNCRAASRHGEFEQGWERADNRTKREKAKAAREHGLTIAQLRDLERPQQILAALTTHEPAFSRVDAQAMVMDRVKDKSKHQTTLEAVLAQAVPLRHKATGDERYTTRAVQAAHTDLEAAYRGMAADRIGAIATDTPQGLTPDQQMAFAYATSAGGKLRVITGVPDAGKTHLLDAIADAYRAKGYTARAVSVANSAVEVLRQDTTLPARSVCAEVFTWTTDNKQRLGPRDLLIIDEVSTLGVQWARDLIVEARQRGAIVLETADDKQFQAVAYGDALGMARTIESGSDMKTTVRQKTEWQARATEDLRAGRIRAAFDAYHAHGHIQLPQTVEQARKGLVTRWTEIERTASSAQSRPCATRSAASSRRCCETPTTSSADYTGPRSFSKRWTDRRPTAPASASSSATPSAKRGSRTARS